MSPKFGKNIFPVFLLFLLLSLFLILLDREGVFRPLRDQVERMVVPAKTKIYQLRQPKDKNIAIVKYQEEKERMIASLESQLAVLKSENAAARRLLGAPLPADWRFLPAQVMGVNSDFLQIDKGRAEGVKEGMVVVLEKVLVGKVVRSSEHFSQVLLPSSEGAKILAISRLGDEGEVLAKGVSLGQAARLSFERVLLEETLEPNDWVMTAGDEIFPPNLLLGKITKVFKKEGEIYQRAEIEPVIRPEHLEIVFVVIGR